MRKAMTTATMSALVTVMALLGTSCGGSDEGDATTATADPAAETTNADEPSVDDTSTTEPEKQAGEFESDTLDLPLDPAPTSGSGEAIGRLEFVVGTGSMGNANYEGVEKPCAYFLFDDGVKLAVGQEGYDFTIAPGGPAEGKPSTVVISTNDGADVPTNLAAAIVTDPQIAGRDETSAPDRVTVVYKDVVPVSAEVADYCTGELDKAVIITGIEPAE